MSLRPISKVVSDYVSQPRRMLIGGKWVDSLSGKTFATYNPADASVLCASVAEGQPEDVNVAVEAARRAFESDSWRRMSPLDRGKLVWKIGELIEKHADEFAELESLDNGKPFLVARAADVLLAANMFYYMAGWATKLDGRSFDLSVPYTPGARYHAETRKEPVGVVGQIIPWNFPLLMAAWKLAPALTTGCTVILKPAEQTPLSALRLGELIQEAGFPPGVVNIVTGFGEAGAALAAHDGVDKVAFTGSTEVGKLVLSAAQGNLKKVSLELGGKSPNIILADADLETAIPQAAGAIFFNCGQCCCAGSRLYVHESHFQKVVDGVSEIAAEIKVGPGMDSDTQLGPLVSDEQLARVDGFLQSGYTQGAMAASGGSRLHGSGYFLQPTVLTNTTPNMNVVTEEIFGPVVCAMPFGDLDEVAAAANETSYGLAAGIWTRDLQKAHQLAERIRAGTVWVNCYNIFDSHLPFGGYKESGWGREMGPEVLNLYMETKSWCIRTN